MKRWPLFVWVVVWSCVPAVAHGQGLVVQGSAGPTLVDRGYSAAAAAGWSPWSRVAVSLAVERTHLVSRVHDEARGSTAAFRGGTVTLGAAQLELALFARDRVTPYLVGGFAAGRSRPTVNAAFPVAVVNGVQALFGGAGLHVPLGPRLALFAEARLMLGEEADELLAVAPVRLGLSWRF